MEHLIRKLTLSIPQLFYQENENIFYYQYQISTKHI